MPINPKLFKVNDEVYFYGVDRLPYWGYGVINRIDSNLCCSISVHSVNGAISIMHTPPMVYVGMNRLFKTQIELNKQLSELLKDDLQKGVELSNDLNLLNISNRDIQEYIRLHTIK